MDRYDWAQPVSKEDAYRRAGGRRYYNSLRTFRAHDRRHQVVQLIHDYTGFGHGAQSWIARRLGVSRSTICRDFAALLKSVRKDPLEEEIERQERRLARREYEAVVKDFERILQSRD